MARKQRPGKRSTGTGRPLPPVRKEAAPRGGGLVLPLLGRGMFWGLLVLLVGELLAMALVAVSPAVAGAALALVGAAGPAVAGLVAGRSGPPATQGALAAVGAYLLTLPVKLLDGTGVGPGELTVGPMFAAVVGVLAGEWAANQARRQAGSPGASN